MYLRIKKIKGREYAYLVEKRYNRKKKKARQCVVQYLGKVILLEREKDVPFTGLTGGKDVVSFVEESAPRTIFLLLIKQALLEQGFISVEKGESLVRNNLCVTPHAKRFKDETNHSSFCLEINQGFLTSYSIEALMNVYNGARSVPTGSMRMGNGEDTEGKVSLLARQLRSEGLDPTPELFVALCKKMLR